MTMKTFQLPNYDEESKESPTGSLTLPDDFIQRWSDHVRELPPEKFTAIAEITVSGSDDFPLESEDHRRLVSILGAAAGMTDEKEVVTLDWFDVTSMQLLFGGKKVVENLHELSVKRANDHSISAVLAARELFNIDKFGTVTITTSVT